MPLWARIALGASVFGVLHMVGILVPPSADEAAGLRWMRVLDEHPLRSTLALVLLLEALLGPASRRGGARTESEGPPPARPGS